jgi:pimeloyl-ACP methyl ester carboxylesterase
MAEYVAPVERLVANARRPVVLVGHSMGGLTLSYLGERYSDRIAALIYLAALMPWRGMSLADGAAEDSAAAPLITPREDGRGMRISLDAPALQAAFYGDCSERDVAIAVADLSEFNPMPPLEMAQRYLDSLHPAARAAVDQERARATPMGGRRKRAGDPGDSAYL